MAGSWVKSFSFAEIRSRANNTGLVRSGLVGLARLGLVGLGQAHKSGSFSSSLSMFASHIPPFALFIILTALNLSPSRGSQQSLRVHISGNLAGSTQILCCFLSPWSSVLGCSCCKFFGFWDLAHFTWPRFYVWMVITYLIVLVSFNISSLPKSSLDTLFDIHLFLRFLLRDQLFCSLVDLFLRSFFPVLMYMRMHVEEEKNIEFGLGSR
jgi:hypothetical protein